MLVWRREAAPLVQDKHTPKCQMQNLTIQLQGGNKEKGATLLRHLVRLFVKQKSFLLL